MKNIPYTTGKLEIQRNMNQVITIFFQENVFEYIFSKFQPFCLGASELAHCGLVTP